MSKGDYHYRSWISYIQEYDKMFHVTDKQGERVASYKNLSEAITYWQHSAKDGQPAFDQGTRENEIVVFDSRNDEIGSILLPREWEATEEETAVLERVQGKEETPAKADASKSKGTDAGKRGKR